VVIGELVIEVSDDDADYSALRDIHEIQGMSLVVVFSCAYITQGPLVIRNSSMTSLFDFKHLEEINTLGLNFTEVSGQLFSAAIYGSSLSLL
jgi:hypothetical protein